MYPLAPFPAYGVTSAQTIQMYLYRLPLYNQDLWKNRKKPYVCKTIFPQNLCDDILLMHVQVRIGTIMPTPISVFNVWIQRMFTELFSPF